MSSRVPLTPYLRVQTSITLLSVTGSWDGLRTHKVRDMELLFASSQQKKYLLQKGFKNQIKQPGVKTS
jgi:hypothetical protein